MNFKSQWLWNLIRSWVFRDIYISRLYRNCQTLSELKLHNWWIFKISIKKKMGAILNFAIFSWKCYQSFMIFYYIYFLSFMKIFQKVTVIESSQEQYMNDLLTTWKLLFAFNWQIVHLKRLHKGIYTVHYRTAAKSRN